MTYTLPDRVTIEYTVADSYGGPNNCFSKQNVNSDCVWWRCVETAECSATGWQRSSHRNMHTFIEWLQAYDTFEDFLEGEDEG